MNLESKRIAIFGMGKSGISALKLAVREGAEVIAVNNGNPTDWPCFELCRELVGIENLFDEKDAAKKFAECELIILSPGIPREHPSLKEAMEANVPVWSEIELAYRYTQNEKIVAVTGTNGKTTTVSMMGEMLKSTGKRVFVGGNIGTPFCEYILEGHWADYILLELSSFQLESTVEFHPDVAMVLNVFPNHGERYSSVEDYAKAKFNISKMMTEKDHILIPENDSQIRAWAEGTKAQVRHIETEDVAKIRETISKKYDLSAFKLQGGHNLSNLLFMLASMEILGIERRGVQSVIDSFAGVDYRVQFIDGPDKFVVYNDAKSTNWDAVKTAVKAIDKGDKELNLILGGQRRGRGDTLIPHLDELKKADRILLIGETAEQFGIELEGTIDYMLVHTIEKAVELLRNEEYEGFLLFSPGLPSFDQFKNYVDRGRKFTALVSGK